MGLLERIADYLGYTKTESIANPADWMLSFPEDGNIPERNLPDAQLELYQRLSWVQIAVSTVSRTATTAALRVVEMNQEREEQLDNHPFEQLLTRPNPLQSRSELLEATFAHRALTGNCYWWLNRASGNVEPDEIWVLPSNRMRPVPDRNLYLKGYLYQSEADGREIPLELHEVVHFRQFHPLNEFVGLSPIESLATIAQGDMAMQKWNTNYFDKNNAKAPGALAYSDPIDDETWYKMKHDIKAQHGGTKRNLLMLRNVGAGGVQWIQMAMSQKDMEFLAARKFNKEEIFAIFAPGLSSVLDVNATEANAQAGKGTFIEFGVWPQMVSIAEKITNDILPVYGNNLVARFDDIRVTDRELALKEQEAFERVHTVNEVREHFYNALPVEGADLLPGQGMLAEQGPTEGEIAQKQIFGYHITTGVATRDEARAQLGLPAGQENTLGELDQKLTVAAKAIALGGQPEQVFRLVDLDLSIVEDAAPRLIEGPTESEGETPEPDEAAERRQEIKAFKRWIKKRPNADVAQFQADYLTDDELYMIAGKDATKAALPGVEDGNDAARDALEQKHIERIDKAFRSVIRAIVPAGTTVENITPELAVERLNDSFPTVRDVIVTMLLEAGQLGVDVGVAQAETILGVRKATININWDLVNQAVIDWVLGEYSETLVRDMLGSREEFIRSSIVEWIENGEPLNVLTEQLARSFFSRDRAEMVAATEVTRAYAEGNRAAWREAGIIESMEWRTAVDERVCPICGPLHGKTVSVDGDFEDDQFPPAHPRCRCWIVPVVT